MKIAVAGWKVPAYGAWGVGAVMAFIGSFLPWVEVHIGFGAYYTRPGDPVPASFS